MSRQSSRPTYEANPKLCKTCGKPIPFEHRRNKYCSPECANPPLTPEEQTAKDEANREYHRNYRATHRDKKKEENARYYAKNKDKITIKHKQYEETHKERRSAYNANYHATHREERSIKRSIRYNNMKGTTE